MYAFTDNGDFIQLVTDGTRTLQIKKAYISMRVTEPFIYIYFHKKERSKDKNLLKINWNDVTAPVVVSATDLMSQLDSFISGGGGGWTAVDASTTVKGITKLSVAPVSATDPIAVGDNDARNSNARTPTAHASTHTNGTDDIQNATTAQKGLLTAADWNTFNAKQATLVSGTNIKTVNGNSLLGSGDLVVRTYAIPLLTISGTITSGTNRYFGNMARVVSATATDPEITFLENGMITAAEVIMFTVATAGSNENIDIYIRLNNTTDYLVASLGAATAKRRFTNTAINVPVAANDTAVMKIVAPSWATPPTAVTLSGYLIYRAA